MKTNTLISDRSSELDGMGSDDSLSAHGKVFKADSDPYLAKPKTVCLCNR